MAVEGSFDAPPDDKVPNASKFALSGSGSSRSSKAEGGASHDKGGQAQSAGGDSGLSERIAMPQRPITSLATSNVSPACSSRATGTSLSTQNSFSDVKLGLAVSDRPGKQPPCRDLIAE